MTLSLFQKKAENISAVN